MAVTREGSAPGPLAVLYSYPHAFGAPGIGWTAWNQVNELVQSGHRVHLVAASVARPVPGLVSVHQTMAVGRARVPHRGIGRERAFRWHDRRAAAILRSIVPDVVHAWPLASLRTMEAAAELGVAALREAPNTHTENAYRVVAEEYALLGIDPPASSPHNVNPERLALENREWQAATAILAPSEPVRASFIEKGFPDGRILRHRYGYRPQADARTPAERPAARPLTAVFVGRGEPRKGLHYALRAWAASSASADGRFLVYGAIDEGYGRYLEPLLGTPGVSVRGFTDDPAAVFASADVLLLPTVEEGSALVTYEAQAAGCVPLVSTAAGADLVDDVHGLVHEPRDVDALTAQLDRLAGEPETLARLRVGASAHAPELTWAAASIALESAYRSAIGAGSKVGHAGAR